MRHNYKSFSRYCNGPNIRTGSIPHAKTRLIRLTFSAIVPRMPVETFKLPSRDAVAETSEQFGLDPETNIVEAALTDLFARYPSNTDEAQVLLKVVMLNQFYSTQLPTRGHQTVPTFSMSPGVFPSWGWIMRSGVLRWILSTDSARHNSRASVRSAASRSQPSTPVGTVRMFTRSGTKTFRDTSLAFASFTETTGTGSQKVSYCREIGVTRSFTV
jgi:hypothetical protein